MFYLFIYKFICLFNLKFIAQVWIDQFCCQVLRPWFQQNGEINKTPPHAPPPPARKTTFNDNKAYLWITFRMAPRPPLFHSFLEQRDISLR